MDSSTIEIRVPPVIHTATIGGFRDAIQAGAAEGDARVLVLSGGPDVFCSGMDVSGLGAPHDAAQVEESIALFAAALIALTQSTHPTLALVRGSARGGGVGIAAACDVVIAARTATLSLTEGLFGLIPAVIAPVLLERISAARLRSLALTAEPVSAEAAKALGLVDEVVEAEDIDACCRRMSRTLSRVHPRTKGALADTIAYAQRHQLSDAISRGASITASAIRSSDVRDRITRFMEGGAPW